ncbi:helix-turn-helix transcriptional regulator [Xenorhabdus sp. Vera]|uniref:hypothetical protein n=1 Tax=Xenorhabdus koppenhoeferi TaxID=351659 RepID=UPI00199A1A19|nr:hypothetical protein [Xenorhabdus sp. Vera]MBD2812587.1 helix-turn-helix transcriptional regulator [Xenorhabdus sp. Vera]
MPLACKPWEAGRRRIQISVLPEIAKLLSVSLEELFDEEIDVTPRKRGPAITASLPVCI